MRSAKLPKRLTFPFSLYTLSNGEEDGIAVRNCKITKNLLNRKDLSQKNEIIFLFNGIRLVVCAHMGMVAWRI